MLTLTKGMLIDRDVVLSKLVDMLYERSSFDLKRGTFRVKGDVLEIIPVNGEIHTPYCEEIKAMLDDAHISSHVDARNEKLGYRMREAQIKKIPVQIVIGDGEVENRTVTVRRHGSQDKVTMPLDEFMSMLQAEIEEKR